MLGSDKWAAVFYILVLLVLLGVGGLEYNRYQTESEMQELARQESSLKAEVDALKKREAAIAKEMPLVEEMESRLLKPEDGNYYSQILLATVGVQRSTGAQFPTYGFAQNGSAGKFPHYAITGSLTGREDQVFEFIRQLEWGPYRVQIPNVSYTSGGATVIPPPPETEGEVPPGLIPANGQATVNLTLIYTALEPQPDTPLPGEEE